MSDLGAVTTMCVISFPAGIELAATMPRSPTSSSSCRARAKWRPATAKSRRFHPGDLLLCNDLTGKGHVTRAITDLVLAFVNRAKS